MLDAEVIRRVREIQLRAGRQVAEVLSGHYVSVFKGRGVEFDEVRPYLPGDEIRSIDWNVTARTGHPYVKRYVEERQLTIILAVDISRSQDFGSVRRTKREAAAELAALLALAANQNDDRVGLVLFKDQVMHYVPPRKGQRHVLRVIRDVLSPWQNLSTFSLPSMSAGDNNVEVASGGIAAVMEHLRRVRLRRAICFVVSDFWDEPHHYLQPMKIANRRHDVIAVHVLDPRELSLIPAGLVQAVNPETGDAVWIDTSSARIRDLFHNRAMSRLTTMTRQFRDAKIDCFRIETTRSVVDPIVRFFQLRERRNYHR